MTQRLFWIMLLLISSCGDAKHESPDINADDNVSSIVADGDEVIDAGDSESNSLEEEGEVAAPGDAEITSIYFFETEHEFGNVFHPSESKYTFKFKNTGKFPLVIESATASCGCTVPNKPDEPIAPGSSGEIDVLFRPKSNQVGETVSKKITVVANTNPKESYLTIKATVLESM